MVRAAAADGQGNLWITLMVPYTYVYDADGTGAFPVEQIIDCFQDAALSLGRGYGLAFRATWCCRVALRVSRHDTFLKRADA